MSPDTSVAEAPGVVPSSTLECTPDVSPPSTTQPSTPPEGEEQALESHEVIELQTFSERKAWIEEKIKFLEKMPPIEVFVGLDAIRHSAEEVPGLPTRSELQQWIAEHDAIEKETEIFDTGELTKLRQLTKAATQRNLSPEDTDVIELTLTTIRELDKLLHLLRDRSENLELLGIRLTWEEYRISAWTDRRKILDDLEIFLDTRACWTTSVYEEAPRVSEGPLDLKRRGSVTSLASVASDSSITPSAFSRSTRFKLAELLSRDAAQFAGRVTSLRHGKITAAGKALDKLIDHGRKPVPEVLLDEQDKLEEKGITEMENIGKFVMSIVMQWRKADEIYVETMKDKISAQNLVEEIETAKLHHPTPRQSTSFVSRADILMKRLALRGNPVSSSSTFPCPEHSLFPEQKLSNEALVQSLSSEILSATELATKVDCLAKEYRAAYDAVKQVETLCVEAEDLSRRLSSVLERLHSGVSAGDGDGSPPNLMSEGCLDQSHHSAFLALLPSVLEESEEACERAKHVLRSSKLAVFALDVPGIDSTFKAHVVSKFQQLTSLRDQAQSACSDVKSRVSRLRDARRIWASMCGILNEMEDVWGRLGEDMEQERWRRHTDHRKRPLTPGSPPSSSLPTDASHMEFSHVLDDLSAKLINEVNMPLSELSKTLETPLNSWLSQNANGLKDLWESVTKHVQLLRSIREQAAVMKGIYEGFNDLQIQIEDMKMRTQSYTDELLTNRISTGDIANIEANLQEEVRPIQEGVEVFVARLIQRVPFIGQHTELFRIDTSILYKRFSSADLKVGSPRRIFFELPFDLLSLDDAVRADSNTFTMRLNGQLESLTVVTAQFQLARMAKEVDVTLSMTVNDINNLAGELTKFESSYATIMSKSDVSEHLRDLINHLEDTVPPRRTTISRSFSPIRELLRKMDAAPGAHDSAVREVLYTARGRAVSDAELRFKTLEEDIVSFKDEILHAQRVEFDRLEQIRVEEERSRQVEKERLAAEEASRLRAEKERLEYENQLRIEEERQAEELQLRTERERVAAEEAGKARVEKERQETEEKQRLEDEQLLEAHRLQAERARAYAEKAKLRQDRIEMEEKLRLGGEQSTEERRSQADKDCIAAEAAEQYRIEAEKRDESFHEQHLGERRLAMENKHLAAEEHERKRREQASSKLSKTRHQTRKSSVSKHAKGSSSALDVEDVFGLRVASSERSSKTQEMTDLQAQIVTLRKRLRSLSVNEMSRSSKSSTKLPTRDQMRRLTHEFSHLYSEAKLLPASVEDISVDVELKSLKAEVEASAELMKHIARLADLSDSIHLCDAALSDLLEHIDSYPASPQGPLLSSHQTVIQSSPEEQLSARMSFIRNSIQSMTTNFSSVSKDSRAISERSRILQTWGELEEMGNDRLGGQKSRPGSTASSRPSSSRGNSAAVISARSAKKASTYSNLSVSSASAQKRLLVPSQHTPRRAVSGSDESRSRPPTRLSTGLSSNRSVSSSLYGPTFASRQRTASLSNSTSTPVRYPSSMPMRSRAPTGQVKRSGSPTPSEASSFSRSVRGHSRSSTSMSSWSRAPRNSLSSILPKGSTPQKSVRAPRKNYVADPKNKLDVAVGDVVNNLPVGINIEGVSETWKDQSGKYWIGNHDPKLCFCRILRSQTVMVRVGGGWTELSKFINDHFAESFRLAPESPPRPGAPEEKWISSATLLEAPELVTPPRTPEPRLPFVPSFALSTPSGQSPHSIKSNSPSAKGSPLTPLQFIRRADVDAMLRPVTPSKPPTLRARNPATHTPTTRNSVWRP